MIGFYHCDVGLIVPLKEEFDQLHEIAAIEDQYRIGDRVYSHMRFDPLEIWATCVGEMGNAPAMQCAQEFIDLLKPRLLICVGIGGSLNRKDIRLGDVAVSRWVKDISDAAKVEDKDDTYIIKMVGRSFHGDERLVSILENLSPEDYRDWRITCAERMRLCALSDTQKRIGSDWPRVHVKGFASGFVLASDRFQVTETDRELGIAETEVVCQRHLKRSPCFSMT